MSELREGGELIDALVPDEEGRVLELQRFIFTALATFARAEETKHGNVNHINKR